MVINKQIRNTIQREKIKQCLASVKIHPTAEWIYREVKKEIPQITLATVYRNLNFLAEEGQVLRLEINKEFHFDGDNSSHQHCVCQKCGKISDLFQEDISNYVLKNIRTKDFACNRVMITLQGFCKECLKQEK